MAAVIGALRASLGLDTAAFEAGAKRAEASMSRLQRNMARAGRRLEAVGRKLTLGITAPMAAMATLAVKSSMQIIDAQAKLAQSLDTTVKSVQVLARAADLAGVSMGQVEQATIQLTKRLSVAATTGAGPAADALERLGLEAQALLELPLDERISKITAAVEAYVPQAEQAAVKTALFGDRAGLVFTRIDTATLRTATEDVERFGVAVSEVQADQIERTNDALSRLGLISRGVANQLAAALAPTLEAIAGKAAELANWFAGLGAAEKRWAAALAVTAAAIGPVVAGIGVMLRSIWPLVSGVAALTAAALRLAPAMWAAAGPWGVVAALVGAVVARFALFRSEAKKIPTPLESARKSLDALNTQLAAFGAAYAPTAAKSAIDLANDLYQQAAAAREAAEANIALLQSEIAMVKARASGLRGGAAPGADMFAEAEVAAIEEDLVVARRELAEATALLEEAERKRKQAATQVMSSDIKMCRAQASATEQVKVAVKATTGLSDSFKSAAKSAGGLAASVKSLGSELQSSLVRVVDDIASAWGDFVVSGFSRFEDFVDAVVGSFRRMLSQMIADAARNRIVVALGLSAPGSIAGSAAIAGTAAGTQGLLGGLAGGYLATGGGVLGGLWSGLGGVLSGGGLGSSFANLGGLLTGSVGGLGAIGAALPAIGIIAGLGALLKKALGRKYAGTAIRGTLGPEGFSGTAFDFYKGGWLRGDRAVYKDAPPELARLLDEGIRGATDSLRDMAGALSLSTDAIDGFAGAQFTVWLNGKSAEEIQRDLAEQVGRAANEMAELVLGTDQWSRVGETALDTLSRLSSSLTAVNDAADLLGHRMWDVSLASADAASELVDAFGGMDAMSSAVGAYWQAFYSEAERTETMVRRLSERLAELGVEMPTSRAAFRALVEGIDTTTESGRRLYAELIGMAAAMDEVLPRVAEVSLEMQGLLDGIGDAIDDQTSALDELARTADQAAREWYMVGATIRGFVADLLGTALSPASRQQAVAALESRYREALAAAKGGDAEAATSLPSIARDYLEALRSGSGDALSYRMAASRVAAELKLAAGVADVYGARDEVLARLYRKQISVLKDLAAFLQLEGLTGAQLDGLSDELRGMVEAWDDTVAVFDDQLAGLQEAIRETKRLTYDQLSKDIDVKIGVAASGDLPRYLRRLIADAGDGIKANVDLVLRSDLPPADKWLVLRGASEHVKTIDLVLRRDLPPGVKRLALQTQSDLRKSVSLILRRDLDPETRSIALAGSSELRRTVNVALDRLGSDRGALRLALNNIGDYAVQVSAAMSPRVGDRLRRILLRQQGSYAAMIEASWSGDLDPAARRVLLRQIGDYTASIGGIMAARTPDRIKRLLLRDETEAIRRIVVQSAGLGARERALLDAIRGGSTTITLGGDVRLSLGETFADWYEGATRDGIARPMRLLRGKLAELIETIRADMTQRQQAQERLAKIARLTSRGEATADDLATAKQRAQEVVAQIRDLERTTGLRLMDGDRPATLVVRPDGTIDYKATHIVGNPAGVERWRREFWADGGLEDQIFGSSRSIRRAADLLAKLRAKLEALGVVPQFASGGWHAGGWRIVGERGPELEYTGPSRIISAPESRRLLAESGPVAELRALRREVAALRDEQRQLGLQQVRHAKRSADTQTKWDKIGMPKTQV